MAREEIVEAERRAREWRPRDCVGAAAAGGGELGIVRVLKLPELANPGNSVATIGTAAFVR